MKDGEKLNLIVLEKKNGVEYFYGFDIRKNGIRGFLIDSINDVELTDNIYEPRWDVEF